MTAQRTPACQTPRRDLRATCVRQAPLPICTIDSMKTNSLLLIPTLLLLVCAGAQAQTLSSFESGLDGWAISGFNAKPVMLATSTIGATDGAQSLAVTQEDDGFSWN